MIVLVGVGGWFGLYVKLVDLNDLWGYVLEYCVLGEG